MTWDQVVIWFVTPAVVGLGIAALGVWLARYIP